MSTIAPIEDEGARATTELSTTTGAITELDRPKAPENSGLPHHSVGDTPAKPHSTSSHSFRNGTSEERHLAITDDVGYIIPELDMGFFINTFLPPLKNGINVTDVMSSLKGEGLVNSDGKWEKFQRDPANSGLKEDKAFELLADIFDNAAYFANKSAPSLQQIISLP